MTSGKEKVRVTAEYRLCCATRSSIEKLESPVLLGPLDHITQNFTPITVVFVYHRSESLKEELVPLKRFQRSLERLLDYYPHLTGRIVVDEKDNTPRIEQLGAGGKLIEAKSSEPLEAFEAVGDDDEPASKPRLIVTNLPEGGNALLPSLAGINDPILSVQHTRFACGGVAIGMCIRHIICDASGFFQLIRDLSELYRQFPGCDNDNGSVQLSKPPHIHSYKAELHNMTSEERQEALKYQPTGFKLSPEAGKAEKETKSRTLSPTVVGRVLRFSSSELTALKTEANINNNGKPMSTFCSTAAHIWQSISRARARLREANSVVPIKAAQLLIPVDFRAPNQRDVPPQYFPNAVFSPVVSAPAAQLLDAPLYTVAAWIREGIQPQESIEMLKTVRWIVAQPDKRRVQPWYNYEQEGVFVTQWSKFDMYQGARFEVSPSLVAQPFTTSSLYDGLTYFMATEDQLKQSACSAGISSGSIDVSIALAEPIWTILDQDESFRRHRGW
ncbi:hypothetical protein L914_17763 [Phytophthora nicotianae]|uniref:Transferase n=1 Tax=Phytophthora nicotianae TaxID=4792 RepID=W2MG80_PHYNI|nr:hypothetical protein L914_17763 [Phytophthora nicotianae]